MHMRCWSNTTRSKQIWSSGYYSNPERNFHVRLTKVLFSKMDGTLSQRRTESLKLNDSIELKETKQSFLKHIITTSIRKVVIHEHSTFMLALAAAWVIEIGGLRMLKPTIYAPHACARSTSCWLIGPTPTWTTFTNTCREHTMY